MSKIEDSPMNGFNRKNYKTSLDLETYNIFNKYNRQQSLSKDPSYSNEGDTYKTNENLSFFNQNNDKYIPHSINSNNELFEYPENIIQSLMSYNIKENHKSQRSIVRIDY